MHDIMCVHVYMHVSVCMYVCMYVCACIVCVCMHVHVVLHACMYLLSMTLPQLDMHGDMSYMYVSYIQAMHAY